MSTDLAVLQRILSPTDVEEADGLLDEAALQALALHAYTVEEVLRSPLLAAVPKNRDENHKLSNAIAASVKAVKELEALRVKRVGPLNAEVKRVNALVGKLTAPLETFRAKGDKLFAAFNQAERDRVRREQEEQARKQREAAEAQADAERRAAEATSKKERDKALADATKASQAIAAASVAGPEVVPRAYRGDDGAVASRERWVVTSISDPEKVALIYCHDSRVLEVLQKVAQAAVTAGARKIDGVVIELEERTRVTA